MFKNIRTEIRDVILDMSKEQRDVIYDCGMKLKELHKMELHMSFAEIFEIYDMLATDANEWIEYNMKKATAGEKL